MLVEEELPEDLKKADDLGTKGETNLRGHLRSRAPTEDEAGEAKSLAVRPYVAPEKDKDLQLKYALDLLRGIKSVDTNSEEGRGQLTGICWRPLRRLREEGGDQKPIRGQACRERLSQMKALVVATGIVFWTLVLGIAWLALFPGSDARRASGHPTGRACGRGRC